MLVDGQDILAILDREDDLIARNVSLTYPKQKKGNKDLLISTSYLCIHRVSRMTVILTRDRLHHRLLVTHVRCATVALRVLRNRLEVIAGLPHCMQVCLLNHRHHHQLSPLRHPWRQQQQQQQQRRSHRRRLCNTIPRNFTAILQLSDEHL